MSPRETPTIAPADGKLGVLLPGMGAVSTTFIAGVEALKQGLTPPIGSLTQMARIRLGKRTEGRNPLIREFVPLAGVPDLVYGGWDIYEDNSYEAAKKAGVLTPEHLETGQAGAREDRPHAGRVRETLRSAARRSRTSNRASRSATSPSNSSPTSSASSPTTVSPVASWCGAARPRSSRSRAPYTRASKPSRKASTNPIPRSRPVRFTRTRRSSRECRSPTARPI